MEDFFKDNKGEKVEVPKKNNTVKVVSFIWRVIRDIAIIAIFYKQFIG